MVRYLVEDLGLNLNAQDSAEKEFGGCGTPLCYVAQVGRANCSEVVLYLVE